MSNAGNCLSDHRAIRYKTVERIQKFTTANALSTHESEKRWLEDQLEKRYQGKTIVVTHHAPHPISIPSKFPDSPIGPAFYSDLEDLIVKYDIDLWIYGHTHSNLDDVVADTRIVSNQAGYPGEHIKHFNPTLLIEI